MLLLLGLVALAEVPTTVRPIAAPQDAPQQYADWARSAGKGGALVCEALVEEVLLCFQVDDAGKRRWVSTDQLAGWEVDQAGFMAVMRERAGEQVKVEKQAMDAHTYWVGDAEAGWEMAGLLRPDRLAEVTSGGLLHVVAPLERTLIAWTPGSAVFDQIMAVGALEMTQTQNGAVSPAVLSYRDEKWSVFGVAVPSSP